MGRTGGYPVVAEDWERVKSLRALAADQSTTEGERQLAKQHADRLEAKLRKSNVRPANDTTVTARDGRVYHEDTMDVLNRLFRDQWKWNPVQCLGCGNQFICEPGAPLWCENCLREHAGQYKAKGEKVWLGKNARQHYEQDIVEEQWQSDPEDEDAGYDIYEGQEWDG